MRSALCLLALCSCESDADSIADNNEIARDDGSSISRTHQKPKIHGDAIIAALSPSIGATHLHYLASEPRPDSWYQQHY